MDGGEKIVVHPDECVREGKAKSIPPFYFEVEIQVDNRNHLLFPLGNRNGTLKSQLVAKKSISQPFV